MRGWWWWENWRTWKGTIRVVGGGRELLFTLRVYAAKKKRVWQEKGDPILIRDLLEVTPTHTHTYTQTHTWPRSPRRHHEGLLPSRAPNSPQANEIGHSISRFCTPESPLSGGFFSSTSSAWLFFVSKKGRRDTLFKAQPPPLKSLKGT